MNTKSVILTGCTHIPVSATFRNKIGRWMVIMVMVGWFWAKVIPLHGLSGKMRLARFSVEVKVLPR